MLDEATFATILAETPLVSIDLIVTDAAGRLLVGKRVNEPAKDFYFVPGGRIRKDEQLADALTRIATDELRFPLSRGNLRTSRASSSTCTTQTRSGSLTSQRITS